MAVFEVISGCHEMKSNEVKCFCFLLGTLVKAEGGGMISVFVTSILPLANFSSMCLNYLKCIHLNMVQ